MSDEIPTIRNQAEVEAYADASRETRVDRAEGYITRVQELEQLNAAQAEIIEGQRLELLSKQGLLESCTTANLEFQRQISTLTEQLENAQRLHEQDFDREA